MAKEIINFNDEETKLRYRHTASHILAQAVKRLWPEAKLAIGPAIKSGFYYDFDLEHKFTEEDLEKIEKEMKRIVKSGLPLERFELSREEALDFVAGQGEDYKVELINDLPEGEIISFYKQGDFTDLCAGPHMDKTSRIKALKLTSVAGAYWRGDSEKKMLQRIYGTCFPSQEELDEYLYKIEEAKMRDHRKIGKEMDLFTIFEEGPGFPFFLPKGMVIRNQLETFWREEHRKRGYEEIKTPLILNEEIWHTSGHWGHYKDNMYFTKIDEADYAIKPMNCPGAMLTYGSAPHSYRDFPIRLCELGQVHRHELSGALHGLMRVRTFTQDDAHIFRAEGGRPDHQHDREATNAAHRPSANAADHDPPALEQPDRHDQGIVGRLHRRGRGPDGRREDEERRRPALFRGICGRHADVLAHHHVRDPRAAPPGTSAEPRIPALGGAACFGYPG